MTKDQLMADLRAACIPGTVSEPELIQEVPAESRRVYQCSTMQATGIAQAVGKNVSFYVFNEGVVPGPLFAENGDPILDGEGNQVVVPLEESEDAYYAEGDKPVLPVKQNNDGLAYLAQFLQNGTIRGFELVERPRADLGAASYFIVKVWVVDVNAPNTVSEQRWRVAYTLDGTAVRHDVIV